ncbi:hypothetical protein J4423_00780 [Candidatus Pacearchaeota archaeon]|nr:hypothetical protein [Candidatus Pacearchaeota archaeon]
MKQEVVDKHRDNSAGVVGIIFGIMAIVSGVAGVLFGFIGFWFALYQYRHSKNKWAVWGLILTIIGFILGIVFVVYLYYFVGSTLSNLQGTAG